MPLIEYGEGGILEQDPTIDRGYHPTLESRPIKKKIERGSARYITIM